MILIYTGNGKGKTSSCVGQAIRAHGQGMKVCFAQFMKSDNGAGEQVFLKSLLGEDFFIGGIGFFTKEEDRSKHEDAAKKALLWAKERIKSADMLILDETLYAFGSKLISQEDIEELMEMCEKNSTHLVLSGRGLPDWIIEKADTISEITEVKHACQKGIPATKGIEF